MISRRQVLAAAAPTALGWLGSPSTAWAGGQIEEPLADSVRATLSSAVANAAPPEMVFPNTESRLAYLRWLGAMSPLLARRMKGWQERKEFLQTVWYESRRARLETALVLGLVQVESAFRKYAVSPVGARGYMQVMPFWSRLIGDGDANKLFYQQTNLRYGCTILQHYLIDREKGNLFLALGRYNGSRGRPEYPNAVLAARKQWEWKDVRPDAVDPSRPAERGAAGAPVSAGPN